MHCGIARGNGAHKRLATSSADRYNWRSSYPTRSEGILACPFFMPTEKFGGGAWIHPSRLPLGAGWRGFCTAPGTQATLPADDQLTNSCNLGYARRCPNLPPERACDAVRFSIARDCETRILLWYVCEFQHLPVEHGTLEYEIGRGSWIRAHRDQRIQKMAECYLRSYTEKTRATVLP